MLIFSIKTAILATNFLYEHIWAHEWDYALKLNYYTIFWKENMATSLKFPEIPSFIFLEIVLREKTLKSSFEMHLTTHQSRRKDCGFILISDNIIVINSWWKSTLINLLKFQSIILCPLIEWEGVYRAHLSVLWPWSGTSTHLPQFVVDNTGDDFGV